MRCQRPQPFRLPALPMHHRNHKCIGGAHRLHSILFLVRRVLDLERSESVRSGTPITPRDNHTRRGGCLPSQLRRTVHYRSRLVPSRNTRIPSVYAFPTPNTTTTDIYPPLDTVLIESRALPVVTTATGGHPQANPCLVTSCSPRGGISVAHDLDSRHFQRLSQALKCHIK